MDSGWARRAPPLTTDRYRPDQIRYSAHQVRHSRRRAAVARNRQTRRAVFSSRTVVFAVHRLMNDIRLTCGLPVTALLAWTVIVTEGERTASVAAGCFAPCRIGASDSCAERAGSRAQSIRLCAVPRTPGAGGPFGSHDADPVCPGVWPLQSGRRPGGCRRPSGIGEGGTCEQRRADARLREDAGPMRICRRVGKGPPAAVGRRRPFAFGSPGVRARSRTSRCPSCRTWS